MLTGLKIWPSGFPTTKLPVGFTTLKLPAFRPFANSIDYLVSFYSNPKIAGMINYLAYRISNHKVAGRMNYLVSKLPTLKFPAGCLILKVPPIYTFNQKDFQL